MYKTILITGASSGIGNAVGEYLSESGHTVIGAGRNPEKQPVPFEMIKMDVTDDASVDQAIQGLIDRFDQINVLINNAGYGLCGPIESSSIKEAKDQFDTNYFGPVRVTSKLLPHFRTNKSGLIINMGSLGGLMGLPFQGHYSASKFALEGYMESLRYELMPFEVDVCNINPADFKTSFSKNRKFVQKVEGAYRDKFNQFKEMYEQEEEHGADPVLIAKLVHDLTQKKKVRPRYLVGKKSQTRGYPIKRLLGSHLFERLMVGIWKAQ